MFLGKDIDSSGDFREQISGLQFQEMIIDKSHMPILYKKQPPLKPYMGLIENNYNMETNWMTTLKITFSSIFGRSSLHSIIQLKFETEHAIIANEKDDDRSFFQFIIQFFYRVDFLPIDAENKIPGF